MVRAWGETYGLPYIVTNCSNNYCPHQNIEKLIPKTITNILNINKIPIYGDGKQIRDWLFVEDHIAALLKIATTGNRFSSYNIGGDNQITNLDLVMKICKKMDKLVPLTSKEPINSYADLIEFVPDRPGHDRRYAIDSKKIETDLNWHPKTDFDEGLEKTIKWYISNF